MTEQNKTVWIDAVRLAMKAEQGAAEFYAKAAERTGDPRGRDMFAQLAAFEKSHYTALGSMLENAQTGAFAPYAGTGFADFRPEQPAAPLSETNMKSDIDALTIAIDAEKKAQAAYREMAESADDPEVLALFHKLAEEEAMHKKVLEDQVYALSNQGHWTWGE